ncbi:MAG: PAS domain S-box protein [Thermodesulfobacteriota bacterium]
MLEGHLNECLGELLLEAGHHSARMHFAEAARLYRKCRAERKEANLLEKHAEHFEDETPSTAAAPTATLPSLDVDYLMKSSLAISAEIEQESLLRKIMNVVIESSGAQHGYLLIEDEGSLFVCAESHISPSSSPSPAKGEGVNGTASPAKGEGVNGTASPARGGGNVSTLSPVRGEGIVSASRPTWGEGDFISPPLTGGYKGEGGMTRSQRLEEAEGICKAIARYVYRTGERVILNNACQEGIFKDNPEVLAMELRSVLCLPVVKQSKMTGILYMENRLAESVFTPEKAQMTELLTLQAAISFENATLLKREQFLADLVRNASVVMATGYADGRLGIFNVAFQKLTGYDEEELKSVTWNTMLTPSEWREHEMQQLSQLHLTRSPVSYEKEYIRKDGSRVPIEMVVHPFFDDAGNISEYFAFISDISERKRDEDERQTSVEFLRIVNESRSTNDLIRATTALFQQTSGCEAVGIRLKREHDYPYYETRGFPKEFVLVESRLCSRDEKGQPILDNAGNPILECMCGNVICGRFDPSKPFFTQKGSFWTNSTTELLASTTEADRQVRTRNRCNGEGYESVALFALRLGEDRLGLLQLNDKQRGRFNPETIAFWERLADYLAVALSKVMAEESLRASNDELTRFNRAMVGRELHMVELKKEVNELCRQAGLPLRYRVDFGGEEEKPTY